MKRAPHIEAGQAGTFLDLIEHAAGLVGEANALPFLRGWLGCRAAEPVASGARKALADAETFLRRHTDPPPAPPASEPPGPIVVNGGRR